MNRAGADNFKPVAPQLPADIQLSLKNKAESEAKKVESDEFAKEDFVAEVKPKSGGLFSGLFGSA